MSHPRVQEEDPRAVAAARAPTQLLEDRMGETVYAEALPLGHSQATVSINPRVATAAVAARLSANRHDRIQGPSS